MNDRDSDNVCNYIPSQTQDTRKREKEQGWGGEDESVGQQAEEKGGRG